MKSRFENYFCVKIYKLCIWPLLDTYKIENIFYHQTDQKLVLGILKGKLRLLQRSEIDVGLYLQRYIATFSDENIF